MCLSDCPTAGGQEGNLQLLLNTGLWEGKLQRPQAGTPNLSSFAAIIRDGGGHVGPQAMQE